MNNGTYIDLLLFWCVCLIDFDARVDRKSIFMAASSAVCCSNEIPYHTYTTQYKQNIGKVVSIKIMVKLYTMSKGAGHHKVHRFKEKLLNKFNFQFIAF